MKSIKMLMAGLLIAASASAGCAYGGVATTSDNKTVIAKNNGFLFGILNKVYVCDTTPAGLANCATGESP